MKDRQKTRFVFEGAMKDLTDAGIIAVDANDSGAAVEFAVWVPPEDVEKFLADIQRAATQRRTTIDLYGPPRYARSTTGGRPPVTWRSPGDPDLTIWDFSAPGALEEYGRRKALYEAWERGGRP